MQNQRTNTPTDHWPCRDKQSRGAMSLLGYYCKWHQSWHTWQESRVKKKTSTERAVRKWEEQIIATALRDVVVNCLICKCETRAFHCCSMWRDNPGKWSIVLCRDTPRKMQLQWQTVCGSQWRSNYERLILLVIVPYVTADTASKLSPYWPLLAKSHSTVHWTLAHCLSASR